MGETSSPRDILLSFYYDHYDHYDLLQADWDGTFSEMSFGFRPGRSAHQAVEQAQAYIATGHATPLPRRFHRSTHFRSMDASLQAANGPPRTRRRMIDAAQRIGSPPARSPLGDLAREQLVVSVGGVEQLVEVERQERPRGGAQGYWRCPVCDRRCCALFVVGGALCCRKCGSLDYRSRHVLHPAVLKAAKLRRKLGAAPGVLSRIPPRPPHWRSDYWARSLRELAAQEAIVADLVNATVRAAKRQRERLNGQR